MTVDLRGKIVLVSAAAQGIGRASALEFARHGAKVHAIDINEVRVRTLEDEHEGIATHKLDVLDETAIQELVQQIGPIDILFNCAGIVINDTILNVDFEYLDFAFDLNVKSMVRMIRSVLPGMLARGGGSIINMGSVSACTKGVPNQFTFGTTKAAVIGLTKSVAAEYVGQGIRCNAICPGYIDTPSLQDRLRSTGNFDVARETVIASLPMGRIGTPEEVAALVVYVAGATYATGQTYVIDGGLTT
jgi:2-keto-3-deoxy-L-fuconate dehydrogenase